MEPPSLVILYYQFRLLVHFDIQLTIWDHHISTVVVDVDFKRNNTLNTLRPRQNGRHFADDTFKRIFLNEHVRISIEISMKFVPRGLINNIRALVQIMAWRRPGNKPLSEPMIVRLPTHTCVARPQWVIAKSSSMRVVSYLFSIGQRARDGIITLLLRQNDVVYITLFVRNDMSWLNVKANARSREASIFEDYAFPFALEFDRYLDSIAVEMPDKF